MNVKKFLLAALALVVFIFLYNWLVNGVLLKGMYMDTAGVWRNWPDMQSKMPLEYILEILIGVWSAFMFTLFFKKGGVKNGLLFGIFVGLFSALSALSWYVWLPITGALSISWFFAHLVEGVLGGLILGSIYKSK